MKKVTITFASMKELWEFVQVANVDRYQVTFHLRMLTAELSEEIIKIAVSKYDAFVLVKQWYKPLV